MSANPKPDIYAFADLIFKDKDKAAKMIKDDPSLVDLTIPNSEETILHFLVIENYIREAAFLLEHGARVDTTDSGGATPLLHAAMLSYREMIALLLSYGANVNHQDKVMHYTALHHAAWRGDAEVIQILLAAGADKTINDGVDGTPLDVAYKKFNYIAEFLK